MTSIAGKDVIIKVKDDNDIYQNIEAISVINMRFNRRLINNNDVTSSWQKLQQSAGIQEINFTINGVFQDTSIEQKIIDSSLSGAAISIELYFGNGKKLIGDFIISSYEHNIKSTNRTEFNIALHNDGGCSYS